MFRGAASVTARERMRRRATTLALVAAIWASARGARAVPAVCTEARLEGLPTLCANAAPDTVQTGQNPTAACCDELRELNDARCFCSEPFLGLDATRQGALVPALATAPRRCDVDTRVGRACRSVAGDDGAEAEAFNERKAKLAQLSTAFSNAVLDATAAFALDVHSADELAGVPSDVLARCVSCRPAS